MRKILTSLILSLSLCACAPTEKKWVFIDSNVTADVWVGDKIVGETPFMREVSGKDRAKISVRKKGYKPVTLPTESHYKKGRRYGIFSYATDASSGKCKGTAYSFLDADFEELEAAKEAAKQAGVAYSHFDDDGDKNPTGCGYPFLLTIATTAYGAGIVTSVIDLFPDSKYMEYDRDSYFVELVPKNKKAYDKDELNDMRAKMMVLYNFEALRLQDAEHALALSALTGKPFAAPAPDDTAPRYMKSVLKK